MSLSKVLPRLILCLLIVSMLSSCRYWSLYRFADQFCEFDQYIELVKQAQRTRVQFIDPVLPIKVFQRYFKAEAYARQQDEYSITEDYLLINLHGSLPETIAIRAGFSGPPDKHRLAFGELDTSLSAVFPAVFVRPILASACSDDFDLSLSELDLRFKLNDIAEQSIPTRQQLEALFGQRFGDLRKQSPQRLNYELDFIARKSGLDNTAMPDSPLRQQKEVNLEFGFTADRKLSRIHVSYVNYQLWLDFEHGSGRLHVDRRG